MDINQKVFYGETLYDFEAYLDRLLVQALEPYAGQIHGKWKASTIKEKVEILFADYWKEKTRLEEKKKNEMGFRPSGEGIEGGVAKAICGVISEEVYQHFREAGNGPFYVIDFAVFNKDVENELRKISLENEKYTKNNYSIKSNV
jgi:hypothetical protein